MSKLLLASFTFAASAPALARSDAYNNGYEYGRQIGRFVKAYLPNLNFALGAIVLGIFCWFVVKRRG